MRASSRRRFREGYDLAYLFPESGRLTPAPWHEYDEVVLVDSTAASGLTLLRCRRLLEEKGLRNVKLAAHPLTKHAETLLDIRLPRQEPSGTAVYVVSPALAKARWPAAWPTPSAPGT